MRAGVVVVAICAACGGKAEDAASRGVDEARTSGESRRAEPSTEAPSQPPPPAGASTLGYDARALCESRCLLLVEHDYDELAGGRHTELCRDYLGDEPWPGIDASECERFDILRNCIFAAYGHTFRKPQYQEHFGATSWYRPDPSFAQARLSPTALANVGKLKAAAAECRGAGEPGAAEGKVLARASADLDGDGTADEIVVTARHLAVAGVRVEHEITFEPERNPEGILLRVVDVDGEDRFKEVMLSFEEVTDNVQHQIFGYAEGKLVRLWESPAWSQVETPATGGLITMEHDCGRKTRKQWGRDGDRVVVRDEQQTGEGGGDCMACPYVYVGDADGYRFAGEILRLLDRKELEAQQALAVYATPIDGVIRVRIAEEKAETTYLDELHLVVDGAVIRPRSCAAGFAKYCEADGIYERLEPGERLDLDFAVPGASATGARVVAAGYYVPHR